MDTYSCVVHEESTLDMTKNSFAFKTSDVRGSMPTLGHGVISVPLSPHHTPSVSPKVKCSALMWGLVTSDTLTLFPSTRGAHTLWFLTVEGQMPTYKANTEVICFEKQEIYMLEYNDCVPHGVIVVGPSSKSNLQLVRWSVIPNNWYGSMYPVPYI